MTSQFKTQAEYKFIQETQSFYEPALREFYRIYEIKKSNLRKIGNDENNAAVTREELSQAIARKEKISMNRAEQVVRSLVKAGKVKAFGTYAGNLIPMAGES